MKQPNIIYISILVCIIVLSLLFYRYNNVENFKNVENFEEPDKNDYLHGVDVIYWINLDRSIERREKIEKVFKDPVFSNIPIIRIPAIDGKSQNIKDILNHHFVHLSNEYTDLEYACLLSHLNAIQTFHSSNYSNALIMEDDMTLEFKKYWKTPIQQCMNDAPKDWDILQLTYTTDKLPEALYSKTYPFVQGCGAYLINKKGSTKINSIYKNKYVLPKTVKHVADYLIYYLCNSYTYKYPYFIYGSSDSEIHPDHIEMIHKPNKILIHNLLQNSYKEK